MTEEQIKQNAEKYADQFVSRCFCGEWNEVVLRFIAGANSRDLEIKELNGQVILHKERADYYHYLYMKLRNPWISVEERLPNKRKNDEGKELTESKDVFVRTEFVDDDGRVYISYGVARCFFPSEGGHEWSMPNVTHWMPIQELPKGGEV